MVDLSVAVAGGPLIGLPLGTLGAGGSVRVAAAGTSLWQVLTS